MSLGKKVLNMRFQLFSYVDHGREIFEVSDKILQIFKNFELHKSDLDQGFRLRLSFRFIQKSQKIFLKIVILQVFFHLFLMNFASLRKRVWKNFAKISRPGQTWFLLSLDFKSLEDEDHNLELRVRLETLFSSMFYRPEVNYFWVCSLNLSTLVQTHQKFLEESATPTRQTASTWKNQLFCIVFAIFFQSRKSSVLEGFRILSRISGFVPVP